MLQRISKATTKASLHASSLLYKSATNRLLTTGYAKEAFADSVHWLYLILKAQTRNNAGYVTLRSTNPLERPQITFNSLAIGGDEDVQAVMDAVALGTRTKKTRIVPKISFEADSSPLPQNSSSRIPLRPASRFRHRSRRRSRRSSIPRLLAPTSPKHPRPDLGPPRILHMRHRNSARRGFPRERNGRSTRR